MTRAYIPETYKRVTLTGDRSAMGFGVYGKSNRNKRETGRNGVKFEATARDVYRGFHGKSNRAVCSQPNRIYDTNGTTGYVYIDIYVCM